MRGRLRAIDHLTKTTARAHTLEDIYDAALDAVGTALGTRGSSILLFDPNGVIRFKSCQGSLIPPSRNRGAFPVEFRNDRA
jgi:hypothetical protein